MERNIKANFNRLHVLDNAKKDADKEISSLLANIRDNYPCPNCGRTGCGGAWKSEAHGTWAYKCSGCGFSTGDCGNPGRLLDWLLFLEEAHQKFLDKLKKDREKEEKKKAKETNKKEPQNNFQNVVTAIHDDVENLYREYDKEKEDVNGD